MPRRIDRLEIQIRLQAGTSIMLAEAVPDKHHREGHLPGTIHLPHDQVRRLAEYVDGKKDGTGARLPLERANEKAA